MEGWTDFLEEESHYADRRVMPRALPNSSRYCIMTLVVQREEVIHMTCQWCKHYRRRGKNALCLAPGGNGKVVDIGPSSPTCPNFNARKSCTTCALRCLSEEKETLLQGPDGCPKWTLRQLSSWGGSRRFIRQPVQTYAQPT